MKTQTTFTLGEAARVTGKSKGTISKALSSGKLSARDRDGNSYIIDAAELFRVFPVKPSETVGGERMETPQETSSLKVLQAEIEALRERVADKDDVIADLRRRLDEEAAERRQLSQRLLAAPTPRPDADKRSWWSRLRGND